MTLEICEATRRPCLSFTVFCFVVVLLDHHNSSLAIQTCSDATPSEVLLITIDTRSGQFRVALGDGEGR
jgi:hypothetical protein